MSMNIIKNVSGNDAVSYPLDGSTSVTANTLLCIDTTNGVVKPATSSATSLIVEAIALETVSSGATSVLAMPLMDGIYLEVDAHANTSTNQLNKNHLLTDAGTVNNTSTHNATKEAVFRALEVKGSASDKKLVGRILKASIVTS